VEVNYQSTFKDRLPDETETHLFRIVQEALTNVARHSGATRMDIELHREGGRIHLRMKDNGHGLQNGNAPGGLGLVGMHARARSIGGELTIKSQDGVVIELWTPGGMLQT
jgi:signal transduction histidine kinase